MMRKTQPRMCKNTHTHFIPKQKQNNLASRFGKTGNI